MKIHRPTFALNIRSIKSLISYQFYYVLIYPFFMDLFKLPSAVSYVTDIINMLIITYLLYYSKKGKVLATLKMNLTLISSAALLIVVLSSAMINIVKPTLIIWAARNVLRFFPYFYAVVIFEDTDRVSTKYKFVIKLQAINFFISLYQYFILGIGGDYLGGVFGTTQGCNAVTNVFICLVTIYSLLAYSDAKNIRLPSLIFSMSSCVIVAALAELKVFFLELGIILLFYVLVSRGAYRKLLVVTGTIAMAVVGVIILSVAFPKFADFFTNLDVIMEYGVGTGGGYSLGRFSAFTNINRLFFQSNLLLNLLGFGFGSCEYSSFSMFTSMFSNQYGYLNYRWFSHQLMFLQCGYLGVCTYLLFFIAIFLWNISFKTIKGTKEDIYKKTAIIMSVLVFVLFFYNQTCNIEIAYLVFYALGAPFAACRSAKEKEEAYLHS